MEHVGPVGHGDVEASRGAAGRDEQPVERQRRRRRRARPVGRRVAAPTARVESRRSTPCSAYQPSSWTKTLDALGLAQEESLGQRRSLVGALVLGADEDDVAVEALRRAASRPPWPRPGHHRRRRTCSRALRPLRGRRGDHGARPHFRRRGRRRVNWSSPCRDGRRPWAWSPVRAARCGVERPPRSANVIRGPDPSRRAGREPPAAPARAGPRAGRAARGAVGEGRHRTGGEHGVGGPGRERQRRVQDERGDLAGVRARPQDVVEAAQLVRRAAAALRGGSVRPKGSAERAQSET